MHTRIRARVRARATRAARVPSHSAQCAQALEMQFVYWADFPRNRYPPELLALCEVDTPMLVRYNSPESEI